VHSHIHYYKLVGVGWCHLSITKRSQYYQFTIQMNFPQKVGTLNENCLAERRAWVMEEKKAEAGRRPVRPKKKTAEGPI
jgi:hypothetical protein